MSTDNTRKLGLLLVEDDRMHRHSLQAYLSTDFGPITVAATKDDAVSALQTLRCPPRLAVVDISLGSGQPLGGIEVIERISKSYPETAVLACSVHQHLAYVLLSEDAGARGYQNKDCAGDLEQELVTALRTLEASDKTTSHCKADRDALKDLRRYRGRVDAFLGRARRELDAFVAFIAVCHFGSDATVVVPHRWKPAVSRLLDVDQRVVASRIDNLCSRLMTLDICQPAKLKTPANKYAGEENCRFLAGLALDFGYHIKRPRASREVESQLQTPGAQMAIYDIEN
jgi:DNA-binding NarL/FixJ family response regulator